jgi:hypothetical protein
MPNRRLAVDAAHRLAAPVEVAGYPRLWGGSPAPLGLPPAHQTFTVLVGHRLGTPGATQFSFHTERLGTALDASGFSLDGVPSECHAVVGPEESGCIQADRSYDFRDAQSLDCWQVTNAPSHQEGTETGDDAIPPLSRDPRERAK